MTPAPLVCPACDRVGRPTLGRWRCGACRVPLVCALDVSAARPDPSATTLLGRYREFLPFGTLDADLSLGEGTTPLLTSRSLGPLLGLERLYFKTEGANPTGSADDRASVAGVQRARQLGFTRVGALATGRLGPSLAAYAARAGLRCVILSATSVPSWQLRDIVRHGGRAARVATTWGALRSAAVRLGPASRLYVLDEDDPFLLEGRKTLALELAEQLAAGLPDVIVVPAAPGIAAALRRGFRAWCEAGLARSEPQVVEVRPRDTAELGPDPMAVDRREVGAAGHLLAEEEGLLVSDESAVAFAGLVRQVRAGQIPTSARIVVVLADRPTGEEAMIGQLPSPIETSLRDLRRTLADPLIWAD